MIYKVVFEGKALKDIRKMTVSGNKVDVNKLELILDELELHPYTGTGHPEPLKHQLHGYWSRRINKKDRLLYQVIEHPEQYVVIISALGHY
jgi:toxin YoeB